MPVLQLKVPFEKLNAHQGTLLKWCKVTGEWVSKNEELAICDGNGQQVSLKAPAQGSFHKILVPEGQSFVPGEVLGILRTVMGGT